MSFDTYANLQVEILSLLNRTDSESAAKAPSWIALAEAEMIRRFTGRQHLGFPIPRRMYARDTSSIAEGDEYVAVPSAIIGPSNFTLTDSDGNMIQLDYLDRENLNAKKKLNPSSTCRPRWYTVIKGEFQFYPAADRAYTAELAFIERPDPLSNTNTSNWVLEDHPDAYLYGAQYHGLVWLKADPAEKAESLSRFGVVIDDICNADPVPTDKSTLRTELACLNRWNASYDISTDTP